MPNFNPFSSLTPLNPPTTGPLKPGSGKVPAAVGPSGPKSEAPAGIGGLLGGFGALGLDPQAYRVQPGETLEKIARQHVGGGCTPGMAGGLGALLGQSAEQVRQQQEARVQELIQQMIKLNKLNKSGSLQAGQIILIPPAFNLGAKGKASSEVSFLDQVDAPKLIRAQQQAAQKLADELKAVNLPQRLAYYKKCPPPAPTPADMQWMFQLKAAESNKILHYKPSAQEQELLQTLQESMAWQQLNQQPTRISRADLQQLPASVQNTLKDWMAADGKADDFSSLDLAKASPQAVRQLLNTLKAQGNPPQAQRLTQLLTQLSRPENLGAFGVGRFAFNQGGSQQHDYLSFQRAMSQLPKPDLEKYQANLKAIAATLSDPQLVERGGWNLSVQGRQLSILESGSNTFKDFDLSESARLAESARTQLRNKFQFEPANPYDFEAVKAMKDKLKNNQDKIEFIGNYLQAYFQHPGDGTRWSTLSNLSERLGMSREIFFGNPPALDRLPDGRCLTDCEGFTKLSQILLETLIPDSQALPVVVPGHILNIAKIEGKFYAFNNQSVQALELSAAESKKFADLYDDYDSGWKDLNPFQQSSRMKAADYPQLYEYIQKYSLPADQALAARYKGDYMQAFNRDNVFR